MKQQQRSAAAAQETLAYTTGQLDRLQDQIEEEKKVIRRATAKLAALREERAEHRRKEFEALSALEMDTSWLGGIHDSESGPDDDDDDDDHDAVAATPQLLDLTGDDAESPSGHDGDPSTALSSQDGLSRPSTAQRMTTASRSSRPSSRKKRRLSVMKTKKLAARAHLAAYKWWARSCSAFEAIWP